MDYRVMVSVNVMPKDEPYNSLTFSRQFELHGESFTDIAKQVDFIYDTIEGKQPIQRNIYHEVAK